LDIRVSLSTLSTHQYWAAILLLYTNVWLFFFISVLSVFFDVIIVGCFSSLPPLSRLTSSYNNKLTKCCSLFWSQFSDRWVPNFVFNLGEKLKEKKDFLWEWELPLTSRFCFLPLSLSLITRTTFLDSKDKTTLKHLLEEENVLTVCFTLILVF